MQSLARNGFTKGEVILALHHAHRQVNFRYELLDQNGRKKKDLLTIESGEVNLGSLNTKIKRTAKFTLKHDEDINYLTDYIKPYMSLEIPPGRVLHREYAFLSPAQKIELGEVRESQQGGTVEFALGEFLLSSPIKREENGQEYRDIEGYDRSIILLEDRFTDRYVVTAGTNVKDAVITLLQGVGISRYNIQDTDKTVGRDIEFDVGREKLYAINELLRTINFEPIHVDVNGYFVSNYYRPPSDRASEYSYVTDSSSITMGGYEEELDTFNVPNQFIAVRSNDDQPPLRSVYTNDNPDSPISTIKRGRTITREPIVLENISDQESLDAYVERIAADASQIYGKLEFETAINPAHDYSDVLDINFTDLGISGKYSETEWTIPLQVGGMMKHSVRRLIEL